MASICSREYKYFLKRCYYFCSGQIPTLKRDHDVCHTRDVTREWPPLDSLPCASSICLRASAHELGSNPDSAAPTSPQVKHPRVRVQPWLGGRVDTSQTTNELDSSLAIEASGRFLQHSSAVEFSKLPYQISINHISNNRPYLWPTDQAVITNESNSYNQ